MSKITSYILADVAEHDASDIYDYTQETHGTRQAETYLAGLETTLGSLVEQPNLGRERPEIREGLRSFIYEQHTIFYRIMSDHLRIVRVLHSRRDMPRHF